MTKAIRTLALAIVLTNGCGGEVRPAGPITVAVDTTKGVGAAFVVVTGFSSAELNALRERGTPAQFTAEEPVMVDIASYDRVSPIHGGYVVSDSAVEFHPTFPFDRGREYRVWVSPDKLPVPREERTTTVNFTLPGGDRTPRAFVSAFYPGGDTLPENLLRLYIHFSEPMSRTGALDYVRLLDDRGREVKQAFLPLEADFWNRERTRYTLFLDPGRVKQGILPNEQLGRALVAGRRYSIVIDSTWPDGEGRPMILPRRKDFIVSAPDDKAFGMADWEVMPPAPGGYAPLVVRFKKPLDHGLLMRALGVEQGGEAVYGDAGVGPNERYWSFQPKTPWRTGEYRIVVLTILEDPQGNQIDKAFEVDMFDRVDKSATPERKYIPFTVR